MAKKKEMTPEEKLAEALVPVEEQPYEVPGNWCWTYLCVAADIITGSTPSKKNPAYYGGNFPFYKPADLDFGRHVYNASEYLSLEGKNVSRIIPAESTLVCCIGSIGKSGFLELEGTTNQQINALIPKIVPLYLFFFTNTSLFINQLWSKASSTTISIVNKQKTESCYIPLPPLPEQTRIVNRIESLFAKLDEAKEKIQHVLDGAELRKSAILHKAFTGELTKKWRQEHSDRVIGDIDLGVLDKACDVLEFPYIIPKEWCWVSFNEICTFIGSGVTPKGGQEVYLNNGIPFIRSQNVLHGELDLSDVVYISDDINNKMKRTQIIGRETLLNITGASIGRSCYVPNNQTQGNVNQHVCIIRYKDYVSEYLPQYWLNSPIMQRIITENQIGQTRQALNFKQIRGFCFPLCNIAEQQEIVRLLDSFLAKEKATLTAAEKALAAIETMKKSILARAFRGELGTNDPTEESATKLLKEILA